MPLLLSALLGCATPWSEYEYQHDSTSVGDTYDLRVLVPDVEPEEAWPVLVFQDGDYWPRHERALSRALDAGAPPFVLIAVAYQGFSTGLAGGLSADTETRRLRDTTEVEVEGFPGTGGAADYWTFLDYELLPAVSTRLELSLSDSRSERATWGFSAFGLAVTQGLLWDDPTYGGYCAGSPSLRRQDEPVFSEADDPAPGTLTGWAAFTMGEDEEEDDLALGAVLEWLDDADQPALDVSRTTLAGEGHRGAEKPGFEVCLEELGSRW